MVTLSLAVTDFFRHSLTSDGMQIQMDAWTLGDKGGIFMKMYSAQTKRTTISRPQICYSYAILTPCLACALVNPSNSNCSIKPCSENDEYAR